MIFKKSFVFVVTFLFLLSICFAEPISVPNVQESYSYDPVAHPAVSTDSSQAKPIGVGSIAEGGDTVSIHVALSEFTGPVDIYFAISAPTIDPNNIYILKSDYTLQPVSKGLEPWKKNTTGPIDEHLFGDMLISSLPLGTYYLYLAVTPAGSINTFYLWTTYFGPSLSELLTNGFNALQKGWILRAKTYFEAAKALVGSSTSNDADTARFFYALTRVASLGFDTYSDGQSFDMNKFGDILDRLGCNKSDDARANFDAITCPKSLPSDSPTGDDYRNFLFNVVRPELEGAIDNLKSVSQSFNKNWTGPFGIEMVESDFGDVLFFRATFKAALAFIYTQYAYNLNVDIDKTMGEEPTTEKFLTDNPDFLKILDTNSLSFAKAYLKSALDDFDAAIVAIQGESDSGIGQYNDFINLTDFTAEEISQNRANIADIKKSLDGPTKMLNNDITLDMSVFFAGLDFRSPNLLPPFIGDNVSGLFPDPTFRGIIGPEVYLNKDIDPQDGIPDILQ